MIPILLKIGPIQIYSYGLMFALAVFVCAYLLSKQASKLSITPSAIYDFVFWVVLSGILGARIFYGLLNFQYFREHPLDFLMVQNGGLAWQGGLIAGFLSAVIYIRLKKWPFWKFVDLAAPYIALGQSIGRLGCFLNGCCYGKSVAWGIYFPVHDDHLHPTQLYDSVGLFLIFLILRKLQKANQKDGTIFLLYLLLACAQRFSIEFFRADHEILFLGLSIFQFVCLVIIFLASAGLIFVQKRRVV